MSKSTQMLIVATPEAAKAATLELRSRRIHPHFAGYLCVLRAAATTGKTQEIKVNFKEFFDDFLSYGDAREKHPYIVPFSTSGDSSDIFFNRNVAGSYAPSSLRPGHAFTRVISVTGSKSAARYTLLETHAAAALEHLLYGQRLPIGPLAMFLYRDYALMGEKITADSQSFVSEFRLEFGFAASNDTMVFSKIFEADSSYFEDMEVTQTIAAIKAD